MSPTHHTIKLDAAEFDAVLAGLRCLEAEMATDGGIDEGIAFVLTNADEHAGLTSAEVSALCERLNLGDDPKLAQYLIVYEHRHGTDIYRVESEHLGDHVGWNSFDEHQDDPVILALCQALGLVFETGEIINIFDMPEVKGVFTFEEPT